MKHILFILIIILLSSCQARESLQESLKTNYSTEYEVITIDSCEYIILDGCSRLAIAHKGNCSNPIHNH